MRSGLLAWPTRAAASRFSRCGPGRRRPDGAARSREFRSGGSSRFGQVCDLGDCRASGAIIVATDGRLRRAEGMTGCPLVGMYSSSYVAPSDADVGSGHERPHASTIGSRASFSAWRIVSASTSLAHDQELGVDLPRTSSLLGGCFKPQSVAVRRDLERPLCRSNGSLYSELRQWARTTAHQCGWQGAWRPNWMPGALAGRKESNLASVLETSGGRLARARAYAKTLAGMTGVRGVLEAKAGKRRRTGSRLPAHAGLATFGPPGSGFPVRDSPTRPARAPVRGRFGPGHTRTRRAAAWALPRFACSVRKFGA